MTSISERVSRLGRDWTDVPLPNSGRWEQREKLIRAEQIQRRQEAVAYRAQHALLRSKVPPRQRQQAETWTQKQQRELAARATEARLHSQPLRPRTAPAKEAASTRRAAGADRRARMATVNYEAGMLLERGRTREEAAACAWRRRNNKTRVTPDGLESGSAPERRREQRERKDPLSARSYPPKSRDVVEWADLGFGDARRVRRSSYQAYDPWRDDPAYDGRGGSRAAYHRAYAYDPLTDAERTWARDAIGRGDCVYVW